MLGKAQPQGRKVKKPYAHMRGDAVSAKRDEPCVELFATVWLEIEVLLSTWEAVNTGS